MTAVFPDKSNRSLRNAAVCMAQGFMGNQALPSTDSAQYRHPISIRQGGFMTRLHVLRCDEGEDKQ
jgi:hypothetical protein